MRILRTDTFAPLSKNNKINPLGLLLINYHVSSELFSGDGRERSLNAIYDDFIAITEGKRLDVKYTISTNVVLKNTSGEERIFYGSGSSSSEITLSEFKHFDFDLNALRRDVIDAVSPARLDNVLKIPYLNSDWSLHYIRDFVVLFQVLLRKKTLIVSNNLRGGFNKVTIYNVE